MLRLRTSLYVYGKGLPEETGGNRNESKTIGEAHLRKMQSDSSQRGCNGNL